MQAHNVQFKHIVTGGTVRTVGALEGFFPRVGHDMSTQIAGCGIHLATEHAGFSTRPLRVVQLCEALQENKNDRLDHAQ